MFQIRGGLNYLRSYQHLLLIESMQNQQSKANGASCCSCHVSTLMKKIIRLLAFQAKTSMAKGRNASIEC
jgi:hypothetical protein